MIAPADPIPAYRLPVFAAEDFRVVEGVNFGDTLSIGAELVLDDIYELRYDSAPLQIALSHDENLRFSLGPDSAVGATGADLHFDCTLTLMSRDAHTTEALVLVETDHANAIAGIYLLPLTALTPEVRYTLVGIDTVAVDDKLAQRGCARFTRGTRITLSSGEQKSIEDLQVGDRILTRDDGAQELRWIAQSTVRATGEFAPIRIKAGTLNNAADLIVSPDHRLFIYQRRDHLGVGRAELLVKARHLINGDTIAAQPGGYVDYFQLLFDAHQIIYAEGIAAESMLVDGRSRQTLPENIFTNMHHSEPLDALEIQKALLDRPGALDTLRGLRGAET